jgi:hypothetical protein
MFFIILSSWQDALVDELRLEVYIWFKSPLPTLYSLNTENTIK